MLFCPVEMVGEKQQQQQQLQSYMDVLQVGGATKEQKKNKNLGPEREFTLPNRCRWQRCSPCASAVKHTRPTTQTPWERPLELCHWPLLWGGSTPRQPHAGGALHLSALKGHAYSSLHGALLMVLTHTFGKKIKRSGLSADGLFAPLEEDSFKFTGRGPMRCINHQVPAVVCWMRGTYNTYNCSPQEAKPSTGVDLFPTPPKGIIQWFYWAPPVFWMSPMLNPWYIQCIPVTPLTPVPPCSMAVLLFYPTIATTIYSYVVTMLVVNRWTMNWMNWCSCWWFQPFCKYILVKLDHFPTSRGENKQIFETTT